MLTDHPQQNFKSGFVLLLARTQSTGMTLNYKYNNNNKHYIDVRTIEMQEKYIPSWYILRFTLYVSQT